MQSSGLEIIPNKLQNIPTNSASYQASQIICGFPTPDAISIQSQNVQITGSLQANGLEIQAGSRIEGLPDPISNSEPVTLGYLQSQQQYAQSDVSVGTIQIWYSTTIPADYLLCDGSSFNQLTYPELFTILQTNVLPDLRDRFIVGSGSQRVLKGLQEQSDPYLPAHTHNYFKPESLTINYAQRFTRGLADLQESFIDNVILDAPAERTTASNGGGVYNNYPRNIAVNFIIKAKSTRAFRNSIQNDMLATASLIATNTSLLSNVPLNMGGFKITNVQQPFADQDVATKSYVDQTSVSGALINKLQNGVETLILQPTELQSTVLLNMQNHKIVNLTDPTLLQDAVTLNYLQLNNYTKTQSDSRYYSNLTRLDQITLALSSVSLNNQKIINLQNPTNQQDAMTLNYLQTNNYTKVESDSRYSSNLTTINNLPLATANLNLNNQKIINTAQSTLPQDVVIFRMIQQWITGTSTISQVPASANWVFPFQEINQTSSYGLQYSFTTNRFTVSQPGNFDVTILIKATYTNFNQPITFRINSSNGIINRSITTQQPTSNGTLTTSIARFIVPDIVVVPQQFWLEIVSNPSVVTLSDGCYLIAQKLW